MKKTTATVALATMMGVFGVAGPAAAFGDNDYIGSVSLTGATFCPANTMEAKGQLLPINGNEALFSLFGTQYGGDGRTNFALPDLSAKVPLKDMRYCITIRGLYPSRS